MHDMGRHTRPLQPLIPAACQLVGINDSPFFMYPIENDVASTLFLTLSRDACQVADPGYKVQSIGHLSQHYRPGYAWILEQFQSELNSLCASRSPAFLFFENTEVLDRLCTSNGWINISPPLRVTQFVNDKNHLSQILEKAGIPSIPSRTVSRARMPQFDELTDQFGLPFILQLPDNTLNGKGTFQINHEVDFQKVVGQISDDQHVKLSRFVIGKDLNVSACIYGDEVLVSAPFIQLVGLNEVSSVPLGYCGNIVADQTLISEPTRVQLLNLTKRLGETLRDLGYFGVFGLDLLWGEDGKLYVVEINGRFQSSSFLTNQVLLRHGLTPFVNLHIAAFFARHDYYHVQRSDYDRIAIGNEWLISQVVIYNKFGRIITTHRFLPRGGYILQNGKLIQICDFSMHNVMDAEVTKSVDFWITRILDDRKQIGPGELMWILQFSQNPLNSQGSLNEFSAQIVKAVYAAADIEMVEPQPSKIMP